MSILAYLGLGANLRDPIQQMVDAREMLANLRDVSIVKCSSFYTSSPVGYEQQANFINCVLEIETSYTPIELLLQTQAIENKLGRTRVAGNQNAPRLIDIDVLLFGDQHIDCERLNVPHPRMAERLFVIKPLLELAEIEYYRSALERGDFEGQTLRRLAINP